MIILFKNTTIAKQLSHPELYKPTFLHEYQSIALRDECTDGHDPAGRKTALLVVFDDHAQHYFSSVKFVLYCDLEMTGQQPLNIRQGPVTHTARSTLPAPPNDPTLPQLVLVFEAVRRRWCNTWHTHPSPESNDGLPVSPDRDVLLEGVYAITPDTVSVSVAFEHSGQLDASTSPMLALSGFCDRGRNPAYAKEVITRVVRVVPTGSSADDDDAPTRSRNTILPRELLLKIFAEATNSYVWQTDLLSFAQVCRQWSCSMAMFFARLKTSEQPLDVCALADALSKVPALGRGLQHLEITQPHSWATDPCNPNTWLRFNFLPAITTVLQVTTHLQHLHLSQAYSSQANALFSALPELSNLHSLTITRLACGALKYTPEDSISAVQLARCMARWPALTSLTVENLTQRQIGTMDHIFLQPPACALTQLCIRDSYISDRDLLYLTASSADTLAQVTLDGVRGITEDGLHVFLDVMCRKVTSVTVRNVVFSRRRTKVLVRRALSALVDKMWRR